MEEPVMSAMESNRAAAQKYEGHHYGFSPGEASSVLAAGRRFFSVSGLPLPTLDSVRAAMRSDGEVVSRA